MTTTPKRMKAIAICTKDRIRKRAMQLKVSLLHLSYFALLVVTVRLSAW